jgi:lipopolysaccharide/colanic/teichoic acid biosynthesis glycosyltransferase
VKKIVSSLISKIARFSVIFMVLGALFVLEPNLRDKSSFALPFFKEPKASLEQSLEQYSPLSVGPGFPQRNNLVEPNTFILLFGGIGGLIVRYVRKGFDKLKRFMDISLSVAGAVVCAPVLLIAAVLIKIDSPGPIIYRQRRVGKNGKVFMIYKLRSMRMDAEKGTGAVWAKKKDPRVTTFGRLMRKTHIDEIPQLINVLRGDMSIVGPRPERPEMVRDFKSLICDYEKRLIVKPGITGLAQVRHKYDETIEDVKKKVKYDILYIKKKCFWTDLGIMAQTFGVVITGKGAN